MIAAPAPRTRDDEAGPWAGFFGSSFVVLACFLGFAVAWQLPVLLSIPAFGLCVGTLLLTGGHTLRRIPIPLAWLTFVGWMLSSLTWTDSPQTADFILKRDVFIWLGFVLIGGLLPWRSIIRANLFFGWLTIAVTLFAVAAFPDSRTHVDPAGLTPSYPGWHGFFDHKNTMAPVLVLVLVTIIIFDKTKVRRALSLSVVAMLLIGSTSITGIAVAFVAIAAIAWIRYVRRLDQRLAPPFVVMSLAMMITVGIGSFVSLQAIVQTAGRDLTFTGRTDIWFATMSAIERRPWAGYGMGGLFSSPPTPATERVIDDIGFIVPHAHSGMLDLVAQYGLIGGALFVLVLGSWVSSSMRIRRIAPDLATWNLVIALCLVIVSFSEAVFEAGWIGFIGMATAMNIRLAGDAKREAIIERREEIGGTQWRLDQRV